MKIFFLLFCIILTSCATDAFKERYLVNSSKDEDVEKLIKKIDMKEKILWNLTQTLFLQMSNNLSQKRELTEKQKNDLKNFISIEVEKIYIENKNELDATLYDFNKLYDKYYTHSEIVDLIAFYETPVGKKSLKLSQVLFQEQFKIGETFGYFMGKKLKEKWSQQSRYPTNLEIGIDDWKKASLKEDK